MSDGLEIRWSIKTGSKSKRRAKATCARLSSSDPLPTYLGKMFINPLNDLARITTSGSKQMAVDELNDFVENGNESWAVKE